MERRSDTVEKRKSVRFEKMMIENGEVNERRIDEEDIGAIINGVREKRVIWRGLC